ncbi:DUF4240 domain-containing protein, partial [Priestia megaterium]|uniref:DUF4240 domain-containing protein n=1 Tax=Priestia megaterium TaxID=1404 RepID=UPI0012B79FC2
HHFHQSYTSSFSPPPYILIPPSSDHSFHYFTASLLYQPKHIYYKPIQSPHTIISLLKPLQAEAYPPQLQELLSVPSQAYQQ